MDVPLFLFSLFQGSKNGSPGGEKDLILWRATI
jgi:hypothetical protein